MNTSLNVKSIEQGGRKLQKTIADINPNADGTALKTWAQGLNALTTNTYAGTTKINIDNLTEEDSGGGGSSLPKPAVHVLYTGIDGSYVIADDADIAAGTPLNDVAYNDVNIATDSTGNCHVTGTPAKGAAWISQRQTTAPGGAPAIDITNPVWWRCGIAIANPEDPDCLGTFEFTIDATETTSSVVLKCNVGTYIVD